ncbi:MAG: hypothetical protein AAB152_01240 [Candidatus Coatesbacteria bacterium]
MLNGVPLLAVRMIVLASLAGLLAAALARAGGAVLEFVSCAADRPVPVPPADPGGMPGARLERFGLGWLLGAAALGVTYLGISLVGLCTAFVLVAALAALVAAASAGRARRWLLVDAVREAWGAAPRWLISIVVAALPFAVIWCVPDTEQDCYVYHLGLPWQTVLTHRLLLTKVPAAFHLALPADLLYALPISLGDERLAKWMLASWFVAAMGVFAARALRQRRPGALAGILLILACPGVTYLAVNTKNDLAAAALFATGALLQLDGRWRLGALLLGVCLAVKLTVAPVVLCWLVILPPPRRLRLLAAVLLGLPSLPWWLKSWLAVGNPVLPFAVGLFPCPEWGPLNEGIHRVEQQGLQLPDTFGANLPLGWARHMADDQMPALLALPGLLLVPAFRKPALACALGSVVTLMIGHQSRYLLIAGVFLCLLAGEGLGRLTGRTGAVARVIAAGWALASVGLSGHLWRLPWREALRPLPASYAGMLTTLGEAHAKVRAVRPGRLLVLGEGRTHRMPARVVYGGTFGETPPPWQLARESRTPAEVRKRVRQLGTRHLLYNYVTIEWVSLTYRGLLWDDRALRLWVDFCKRYLVPVWRTETSEYFNGGFYLFEIQPRPAKAPPATVWFAPGTESLYGDGILLHNSGRPMDSLQHYLSVWLRLPDVGTSWNLVGHEYAVLNDSVMAYKYLEKFAHQGMMDSLNLGEFGAACVRTDRLEEGGKLLEEAARRYPGHQTVVRVNQGAWCGRMAVRALGHRRAAETIEWLDRGDAFMAQVPPQGDGPNEAARRSTQAYLLGLRGELYVIAGKREEAARFLQQALGLAPDSNLAGRWRALLEVASPRLF